MVLDLTKNDPSGQKTIQFPVTIKCKPVSFYAVPQLRELAEDIYKDSSELKTISEFLDKLEEV